MPTLELAGARLGYEVAGEGPPLTLLHGFTQDRSSWDEVVGALRTPVRAIRVDLPGHGETTVPATMEAATLAIQALWTELGVDRSHLAGYSLGGRLALHVAAGHPDHLLSLFTIGARGGLEAGEREARRRADEDLAGQVEARGAVWFAEAWGSRPMFAGIGRRDARFREWLQQMRAGQDPRGLAASLRGMGAGAVEPVWEGLREVTVPCLFVAGAEDSAFAAEANRLAALVPDGRAALVPGAGHAAHLEAPLEVAALLDAHLSSR